MRRSRLGVRWFLVLVMLVGLLVSVPQTASAADRDVWAWGNNEHGQLGNGSTDDALTPIQFPTQLDNVVQIAAGFGHSLALLPDGTVWGWGLNSSGQLGTGNYDSSEIPVQVIGPTDADPVLSEIVTIASGSLHVIALSSAGTVYVWGHFGILSGEIGNRPVIVEFPIGTTIVDIASGVHSVFALASDGTVYAWGSNSNGELGIGSSDDQLAPVVVTALNGKQIINVASGSGSTHSFAIAVDGTLYEWGFDYFADGPGVQQHRLEPVIVAGISDVVAVTGGIGFSLALTASGDVYSWGQGAYSGTGVTSGVIDEPQYVMGDATAIAAGRFSSSVLTVDGAIQSWGNNAYGHLGIGSTDTQYTPAQVKSTVRFGTVAAGWFHTLAIERELPVTTTATVNDQPPHDGWYQSASVTLTPDVSATTTYEIDDGTTQTYTTPFALTPDGSYTITFRSATSVDSVEADQSIVVRVDSTAPVIQPIDDQTLNPTSTSGSPVTFTIQVSDNLSSAGTITASCFDQDDHPFASGATAPIGMTTVTCTATDLAGNTGSESFTVMVRGVDGAFDVLQAQIAELEIPRILRMSLHAQVRVAERMVDADRGPLSCLQLRVLDLTIQILGWVRVVDTQDVADIRDQIHLIRDFLDC